MKLSCKGRHLPGHHPTAVSGQPRRPVGSGHSYSVLKGRGTEQAARGAPGWLRSPTRQEPRLRGQRPPGEAPTALRLIAPRLAASARSVRGGGKQGGKERELLWRWNCPPPQRRFPLSPSLLPSLPLGGAGPRGCLPARSGAGARCVTWSSVAALPVRASSNGSAPAGPRRPISWRLVPLPRAFSERIQRRSESYLCAPGPAAVCPASPTCEGEGALPVLPRRLAAELGEGGKESRITSSSGSAVPGVHTHTHTHTPSPAQTWKSSSARETEAPGKGERVHWIKHVTRDGQVSDRRHAAAPAARGWPARRAGWVSLLPVADADLPGLRFSLRKAKPDRAAQQLSERPRTSWGSPPPTSLSIWLWGFSILLFLAPLWYVWGFLFWWGFFIFLFF